MRPLLEVCIDSVTSAKSAIEGGADRLEVCCSLACGGLTPSHGLLRSIRKIRSTIPLFVMIRPRPGDFCFTDAEIDQMLVEIDELKRSGLADGFVTGALLPDGSVDTETCSKLLAATSPFPVTFHRAFDLTTDAVHALETIISLGFDRILTSGQGKNAKVGLDVIKMLIKRADGRIIIVAGCGINDKNVESLLREVKMKEIHSSASKQVKSKMEMTHETVTLGRCANDDYVWNECDEKVVMSMVSIMKRAVFTLNGPSDSTTSENGSVKASRARLNGSIDNSGDLIQVYSNPDTNVIPTDSTATNGFHATAATAAAADTSSVASSNGHVTHQV